MSSYSLPAFLADNSLGLDTTLVVTAIALYFALKLVTNARVGARLPLPPGPPLKPLVGNILSVPREGQWELFTEYKRHYGELVYLEGMGNKILVLNSLSAISDLLDKKGHIYSDRPVFTVVGELMALGQSMPLLPYGNEWREHRKLMHTALSPSAVKKYHFMQEDLAIMMCKDFLDKPEDFFAAVRLTAGKIVLSVTYGLSVGTADDQYITHAEDTMAVIGEATVPGAFLCDLLPILKYAPSWVPFQRKAKKGKDMIEHLVSMPFIQVKKDMAHGIAENSLTRDLLSSGRSDNAEFENRVKWATGAMYGAGGETTYATVLTFIMAMALHPDIQKQAQAEVDDVVGPDRMPRIVDASEMPYVNAVVKEVMRWHPILPLSIARRTTQSDSYKGYFIPEGTVVIPNVWTIAQEDVGRYPAQQFKPERFLDKDHPAVEPSTWAFGFGRRVCPGKHLGENSITALIISILYCFDISPPQSTQLTPAFGLHLVSYPEKFDCQILPRSEIKADVLRRSASEINADSGDP